MALKFVKSKLLAIDKNVYGDFPLTYLRCNEPILLIKLILAQESVVL